MLHRPANASKQYNLNNQSNTNTHTHKEHPNLYHKPNTRNTNTPQEKNYHSSIHMSISTHRLLVQLPRTSLNIPGPFPLEIYVENVNTSDSVYHHQFVRENDYGNPYSIDCLWRVQHSETDRCFEIHGFLNIDRQQEITSIFGQRLDKQAEKQSQNTSCILSFSFYVSVVLKCCCFLLKLKVYFGVLT